MVASSPTMHWKKSSNENRKFIYKVESAKNEPYEASWFSSSNKARNILILDMGLLV